MTEYLIAYTGPRGGPRRFKAIEADTAQEARDKFVDTGKGFVKDVYAPVPRDRFGTFEDPAKVSDQQLRQWDEAARETRDEYAAKCQAAEPGDVMISRYRTQESYYSSVLTALHIWTDGAYGQSLEQQRGEQP
jgi:hypothetical protein